MLPFGVTFPATVPQGSEIPEGLMNNPVLLKLILYKYHVLALNGFKWLKRRENWRRL
jgi:hypothetical protein